MDHIILQSLKDIGEDRVNFDVAYIEELYDAMTGRLFGSLVLKSEELLDLTSFYLIRKEIDEN